MELHRIYKLDKKNTGLSLIEIIVVLGVFIMIVSVGVIFDFSSFTSTNFYGEESKIVALLQKARSRAMANIYQVAHGVCYKEPDYIIFQEPDGCDETAPASELIPANINIASHADTVFPEIVFEQLTGNIHSASTGDTVHITDGIKIPEDIIINDAGTINW